MKKLLILGVIIVLIGLVVFIWYSQSVGIYFNSMSFNEAITFESEMLDNGTMQVYYNDKMKETNWIEIKIYDSDTLDLFYQEKRYGENSFTIYVPGVNSSRIYQVAMELDHKTFG